MYLQICVVNFPNLILGFQAAFSTTEPKWINGLFGDVDNLFIFDEEGSCDSFPSVISSYHQNGSYRADNVVLDHSCEELLTIIQGLETKQATFWLLPEGETGSFILDTHCTKNFSHFFLRNTHNMQHMDRY